MKNKRYLFQELQNTIASVDISQLSDERKAVLQPLIHYIQNRITLKKEVRLNFICTHNSRRSHLSQVWAQTMAHYFGVHGVLCYSGGTEATALFPMAAQTLQNAGFEIHQLSENQNPVYAIKFGESAASIIGFSKTFDNGFNPQSDFAAVMVCSDAEENCPYIAAAEKRLSVTYDDPKAFDGTPQQKEKYHERSMQIAVELFYVFSKIK